MISLAIKRYPLRINYCKLEPIKIEKNNLFFQKKQGRVTPMKFKKVIAQFISEDIDLAEGLICDIFFSFHLKGVICDIPLEEPDEGFGTNTIPKPEKYSITGFLPLLDSSEIILKTIKEKVEKLSDFNIQVKILTSIVDEKDWSNAWKDFFEVTPITDRITIKPEWKDHTPQKDEIVIHLDPGMAFGTGTHPTTFMCIEMIDKYLNPKDSFLDVGTGSGILMITAAKLGAKHLYGIDTDEVAIDVANKNLLKNNIDSQNCILTCETLDKSAQKQFSFIAANIIAQVIVDILPDICLRMDQKTTTILSGIIKDRLNDVKKAIQQNHLAIIEEKYTDEWVVLVIRKK